jgi:hypothetical protein
MTASIWTRRLQIWVAAAALLLFVAGSAAGWVGGLWFSARAGGSQEANLVDLDVTGSWLLRSERVLDELGLESAKRVRIEDVLARHLVEERALRAALERLTGETQSELGEILSKGENAQLEEIRKRYSVPKIEGEAIKELALMRREVGLTSAQQPAVYQVTYDSLSEQREIFHRFLETTRGRKPTDEERDRIDREFRGALERRFERLGPILSPTQIETYRRVLEEREKRWRPPGPPGGKRPEEGSTGSRSRDGGRRDRDRDKGRGSRGEQSDRSDGSSSTQEKPDAADTTVPKGESSEDASKTSSNPGASPKGTDSCPPPESKGAPDSASPVPSSPDGQGPARPSKSAPSDSDGTVERSAPAGSSPTKRRNRSADPVVASLPA